MKSYNPQYPGNAYHCGALMSVFANLQMRALGEVGASVVERYYASAIQMPGLVLGKLSALANYHLDKLNNRTVRNHFVETLSEIAANIKGSIPATLNLAEQSEFALGYYQMQADENKWAKQRTGSAEPLMETVENDENKGA